MPNAMRAGFKAYLESLDVYLIDKYKMKRRKITLKDLANVCRIKPSGQTAEAWKRLFNGDSLSDLYESKILNKELSKTGANDQTAEQIKELKGEVFREQLADKGQGRDHNRCRSRIQGHHRAQEARGGAPQGSKAGIDRCSGQIVPQSGRASTGGIWSTRRLLPRIHRQAQEAYPPRLVVTR